MKTVDRTELIAQIRTLQIGDVIRLHEYMTPKKKNVISFIATIKNIEYYADLWSLTVETRESTLICCDHIPVNPESWCRICCIELLKEAM